MRYREHTGQQVRRVTQHSCSRKRRGTVHTYKSEIFKGVMRTVEESTVQCKTVKELEGSAVQ